MDASHHDANLSWKLAWVLRGHAKAEILETYTQERQPHAREIIGMALMMGRLAMPANRLMAFFIHGFLSLIRLVPSGRALFEDVKIKPQNTFKAGLFKRDRAARKLLAGSTFPQVLVHQSDNGEIVLSDEVLDQKLIVAGFGSDPSAGMGAALLQEWERHGGACVQWCRRGSLCNLARYSAAWKHWTICSRSAAFRWLGSPSCARTVPSFAKARLNRPSSWCAPLATAGRAHP